MTKAGDGGSDVLEKERQTGGVTGRGMDTRDASELRQLEHSPGTRDSSQVWRLSDRGITLTSAEHPLGSTTVGGHR